LGTDLDERDDVEEKDLGEADMDTPYMLYSSYPVKAV
jgi:hypothetical protein